MRRQRMPTNFSDCYSLATHRPACKALTATCNLRLTAHNFIPATHSLLTPCSSRTTEWFLVKGDRASKRTKRNKARNAREVEGDARALMSLASSLLHSHV